MREWQIEHVRQQIEDIVGWQIVDMREWQIEHVRWQIEDQVGWQIVYMVEWQIEHVRLQGRVGSGDPQHEVDGQDGLMQEKETRFKDKIFSC